MHDYNKRFTQTLDAIKKRHDPTVTTVAQGVLEWKQNQKAQNIGLDVQAWLDRFYMSRIGIRFLIGQRRFIRRGGASSLIPLDRCGAQHFNSPSGLRRDHLYSCCK